MGGLPTAEQLAKLPLRAIAAYAARCARRRGLLLRGAIADEIIESPLKITEKLASVRELDYSDGVTVALAAKRLAAEMDDLPSHQARAALGLFRLMHVVGGIITVAQGRADPQHIHNQIVDAARAAAAIPDSDVIDESAVAARIAAMHDYEILLRSFGEHDRLVLGEPIDLSDQWWQKEGAKSAHL